LEIRLVRRAGGEQLFAPLLSRHHYLGCSRPVGEHLKYLVVAGTRPIACLGWSSAPRQLSLRDQFVGASQEAYRHNLHLIASNSRHLIPPWVKVPHLASHLLGRIARRISAYWRAPYHHPIHLLESLVDRDRCRGTCCRAANWASVGRSVGRGAKAKTGKITCSIKELAHCLSHGRREFVTVALSFPNECRHVLESLGEVYRVDAQAREQEMNPEQRLVHHQTHSQPALEQLQAWLHEQMDRKLRVLESCQLGLPVSPLRVVVATAFIDAGLCQPGSPRDFNSSARTLSPRSCRPVVPGTLRVGSQLTGQLSDLVTSHFEAMLHYERIG
jgi:hypothetical protein